MEFSSRCGLECSECNYQALFGCKGCVRIDRPFWGNCEIKDCCEERGFEHCGQCRKFPCAQLKAFAYDEKEGDNGMRIERCAVWAVIPEPEEAIEEDDCCCDGADCDCGHHHHHD